MFLLTTIEKLYGRLQVQPDSGTENAFTSALEGAFILLEAVLQTQLDVNDHIDTFYLDAGVYQPYNRLYRLKLGNGFVHDVGITASASPQLFGGGVAWDSLTDFILAKEKGFLDVPDDMKGKYIKVAYTSGLDTSTPAGIDVVPLWLQEATMAQALKLLSIQQISEEKPALTKIYQMVDKFRTDILDRHLRVSSHAIPAIQST